VRDPPCLGGEPDGAAIATGSSAREIAVAHSTASQPSSIASAASEAVPHAGVEDHRHAGALHDQAQVVGVQQALPEPIGEPAGITAAQPTSSRRRARTGSSFV
jgi:hypothetical protein